MFDENIKRGIVGGLIKLGLKYKDALVYVSLLKLGESGSSKIIEGSGLHGQYVYQSLANLERKGLAQHVIKRGRKKFSAKNPQVLQRLVEQQKTVANEVAAKLKEVMVLPPEQNFEVFQGPESFVAHHFDRLEKTPENSEVLVIGGMGDKFNETLGNNLSEYTALQIRKNIIIKYIGSEGQKENMKKIKEKRKFFEVRYLPGLFTAEVNTNVWPDALGLNIFSEPVTHFTIQNPIIAQSYAKFFDTLWKLSKP